MTFSIFFVETPAAIDTISFSGILAGYAFDQFPEINLLYQIWQAYTGNMKTKHLTDTEQLFEIPVNANAIESPKERAELMERLIFWIWICSFTHGMWKRENGLEQKLQRFM